MVATSVAGALPLSALGPCFVGATLKTSRTQLVAQYGPDELVLCYDFGAVVFVNIEPARQKALLARRGEHMSEDEPGVRIDRAEGAPARGPAPPGRDASGTVEQDFVLEIRQGAPRHGEVKFDRVVVPALTQPVLDVTGLLLAQSTGIERYELALDRTLSALERHTQQMATRGRVMAKRGEIVRLIANTITTKNRIIGKLALLDKPDLAWESEPLDALHNQLRTMLELDDRFHAVEYKLRAVHETVVLLLDVVQTRRTFLLEATIVILIAVEIVLAFFR